MVGVWVDAAGPRGSGSGGGPASATAARVSKPCRFPVPTGLRADLPPTDNVAGAITLSMPRNRLSTSAEGRFGSMSTIGSARFGIVRCAAGFRPCADFRPTSRRGFLRRDRLFLRYTTVDGAGLPGRAGGNAPRQGSPPKVLASCAATSVATVRGASTARSQPDPGPGRDPDTALRQIYAVSARRPLNDLHGYGDVLRRRVAGQSGDQAACRHLAHLRPIHADRRQRRFQRPADL